MRLRGRDRDRSVPPSSEAVKTPTLGSLVAILAAAVAPMGAARAADSAAAFSPPEVISQVRPEYPWSLRLQGKRGEVLLDFVVDTQGNVSRVAVLKSSHPDFEAPAVEALLKSKFKPGRRDGRPVYTHMQVPIVFQLEGSPFHGAEVWSVPRTAPRTVPAQFQYDSPPKPILTNAPVYPFELLTKRVTGRATVKFAVDPKGRTHVLGVSDASHPQFAAAAAAMVASWRFEPASRAGVPCWALLSKEQKFSRDAPDFPPNESAERLVRALNKHPCPILVDAKALDELPVGRFQPGPDVPDSIRKAGVPCTAVIEFIIDHAGHAQLPRILSATDPEFGWAAATAVARWQFTQPLKGGKPADVLVRVPLVYRPENPPGAGS